MPKITSVEPQKTIRLRSGSRRFNVFLDGVFAFGADEDLVVNFRLIEGKEIDLQALEKLVYEAAVGKLMDRMYGLLARRARSEREIRTYLKQLSFKRKLKDKEEISDLTIDQVVQRLKQKNMINDEDFARSWMEARQKSKLKGQRAIKAELFQKGIDREIVEVVIADQSSAINEEDLAGQALEKKLKTWKNLSPLEFKKKAYEFLMRRGFDYEIVKKVVDKILKN